MKIPSDLKKDGKAFWTKAHNEIELENSHDLVRLHHAAQCLDRIAEAQRMLKKEGLYVKDRWEQSREHPAQKTERDNKVLFCRIIRELGLDLVTGPDTRIPAKY